MAIGRLRLPMRGARHALGHGRRRRGGYRMASCGCGERPSNEAGDNEDREQAAEEEQGSHNTLLNMICRMREATGGSSRAGPQSQMGPLEHCFNCRNLLRRSSRQLDDLAGFQPVGSKTGIGLGDLAALPRIAV